MKNLPRGLLDHPGHVRPWKKHIHISKYTDTFTYTVHAMKYNMKSYINYALYTLYFCILVVIFQFKDIRFRGDQYKRPGDRISLVHIIITIISIITNYYYGSCYYDSYYYYYGSYY